MENASKALIMAGEILIGIIILTLLVYVIVTFGEFSKNYGDRMSQQEITQYNSKFEVYEKKTNILGQDIVTLRNMIQQNNIDYKDTIDYVKIKISLDKNNLIPNEYTTIDTLTDKQIFEFIELCNGNPENGKIVFNCIKLQKNKAGRVNLMEFEAKTVSFN